jgi:hypothetical protein
LNLARILTKRLALNDRKGFKRVWGKPKTKEEGMNTDRGME